MQQKYHDVRQQVNYLLSLHVIIGIYLSHLPIMLPSQCQQILHDNLV